jgi:hypothetical protein
MDGITQIDIENFFIKNECFFSNEEVEDYLEEFKTLDSESSKEELWWKIGLIREERLKLSLYYGFDL